MNKYVQEDQKIVNDLVRKSFPSLKNKRIKIFESPRLIYWVSGYVLCVGKISFIFLNTKLRKTNKETKKGILAHELCHVEFINNTKKNLLELLIWGIRLDISWIFGKNPARENERQTDIMTIKKGYGKELMKIALRRKKKFSPKKLSLVYKRGYLSPEEIKQFMLKIKKNKKSRLK